MDEQRFDFYRKNRAVMACGHVANSVHTEDDDSKAPVCSLCYTIYPQLARKVVDIKGRTAACSLCGKIALSSPDLFGYLYNKDGLVDIWYDGCAG